MILRFCQISPFLLKSRKAFAFMFLPADFKPHYEDGLIHSTASESGGDSHPCSSPRQDPTCCSIPLTQCHHFKQCSSASRLPIDFAHSYSLHFKILAQKRFYLCTCAKSQTIEQTKKLSTLHTESKCSFSLKSA